MEHNCNNNNMINENWKKTGKRYLGELQALLDRIEEIKDEELRKEILNRILKCDNELTLLAEKFFEEYYEQGKKASK